MQENEICVSLGIKYFTHIHQILKFYISHHCIRSKISARFFSEKVLGNRLKASENNYIKHFLIIIGRANRMYNQNIHKTLIIGWLSSRERRKLSWGLAKVLQGARWISKLSLWPRGGIRSDICELVRKRSTLKLNNTFSVD